MEDPDELQTPDEQLPIKKQFLTRPLFYSLVVLGLVLIIGIPWLLYQTKQSPPPPPPVTTSPSLQTSTTPEDVPQVTVLAENLDVPWAIAFLPDQRMLVTERKGTVKIIDANGTVEPTPAATLPVDIKPGGEGGLLGIALHPQFYANHFVYLYYTYKSAGNDTKNRVVRMTFENDTLTQEKIIVDQIPGALYHNGGRIRFGPNMLLYITTGDSQAPSLAQNPDSLAGKILRVSDTGEAAPGNYKGLVYSYGHRNPQSLAWDSDGNLFETEHGPSGDQYGRGMDEINQIGTGENYGWPTIRGDMKKDGMVSPLLQSTSATVWAPSGGAIIGNSFFFAGLKGETLYEAILEDNQVKELKTHLTGQYGRLRELILGPDGMLYVTTSNRDGRGKPNAGDDKILRINPNKL